MDSIQHSVPLEMILCTEELSRRPARAPDYETEHRAIAALVQALADCPSTILQRLADTILEVFGADSAGLSLLTKDETRFYWPAIAGAWRPHIGGGTPRDFGPCGDVLDRNAPQLFTHWERRYPYLECAPPPAEEGLLVPFYVKGKAVGTIWAIMHDNRRRFDREDLRQLESLGRFASAAYQAVMVLEEFAQQGDALRHAHGELEHRIQELHRAEDSRSVAIALMNDAVQSRQRMERLNEELRRSQEQLSRELAATRRLHETSVLLIEGGDAAVLHQSIVETACAVMRGDISAMHMLDTHQQRLELLASQGADADFQRCVLTIASAGDACGRAWRTGQRLMIDDVEGCEFLAGTLALAEYRRSGIRALLAAPLVSRTGQVLGVLSTYWSTPHQPSEADVRQFDILARLATDVIERKRGDDALRDRLAELEQFHDVTVGRELRMIELEKQVSALERELSLLKPRSR